MFLKFLLALLICIIGFIKQDEIKDEYQYIFGFFIGVFASALI